MATTNSLQSQLIKFIPEDAADIVAGLIREHGVLLTVARKRNSILGNYRWPQKGKGHRISVNGDLNKYAFFITLIHEMAHMTVWIKYRHTVSAHGREWKIEFNALMDAFKGRKIFPSDVTLAFRRHMDSPAFTHCHDEHLMRALKKYDAVCPLHVEDLHENELFVYGNGRIFKRGSRLRKRIKCLEVATNKIYLFSAIAEVKRIQPQIQ